MTMSELHQAAIDYLGAAFKGNNDKVAEQSAVVGAAVTMVSLLTPKSDESDTTSTTKP